MRLALIPVPRRLVAASVVAAMLAIPASVLAHDEVSGTPDVTIRITGSGVPDRSVMVPVGGIVAFVNADDERHRMRSRSEPGEFDTGNLEPGQRALVRFTTAGSVHYVDERSDDDAFGGTIEVRAKGSGAGSGSGSGSGAGSTTSPPTTISITIGDRIFSPGTVTVATGGRVTWTNRDDREHTATSTGGGPIDSPVLGTGASYGRTFAQPGTFAYLCAIHPEMRGTVKVVDSQGTAPAPAPATPAPAPTATPSAAPTPSATPTPPPSPVPDPSAPTGPGVIEAAMVDFAFDPTPVTIAAGGTVTWTNTGEAPHTVTASDGSFDSGLVASGASFSRRFGATGSYPFVCTFHPEMRGTVEVTAGPEPASAAPPAPSTIPSPDAGAAIVPQATAPPGGPAAAVDDTVAAASTSGPTATLGGLAVIGVVVSINLAAMLLFAKAVGGAVRRPA